MAMLKKTVSIPKELFAQTKDINSNFSTLITLTLQEYIRQKKIEKALASFGSWKNFKEDSVKYVNRTRKEGKRLVITHPMLNLKYI